MIEGSYIWINVKQKGPDRSALAELDLAQAIV